MMINSALWSLTLMIASIVLAAKDADNKGKSSTDRKCYEIKCHTLHASYVSMSMMHVYYRFLLKINL